MANITTKITTFPPAPDSGSDTPIEFNSKADAFVNHQSSVYVGEVNQWATEANALKDEVNTTKTEIDGIVASIPSGSINDGVIGTDKVWSSTKVSTELDKKGDKIILGTNTDLTWNRYPNGTIHLWGKKASKADGTLDIAFPYPLIGAISVNVTALHGSGAWFATLKSVNANGFSALVTNLPSGTHGAVSVHYIISAKWE